MVKLVTLLGGRVDRTCLPLDDILRSKALSFCMIEQHHPSNRGLATNMGETR